MADLDLLPDVEALVVAYLTERDSIVELGAQVAAIIEHGADLAAGFLRVNRLPSGSSSDASVMWHDRALVQLDAYHGTKAGASLLIRTVLAELDHRDFIGVHDAGVVTSFEPGHWGWLPDVEAAANAQPRYIATVAVHTHPRTATGS